MHHNISSLQSTIGSSTMSVRGNHLARVFVAKRKYSFIIPRTRSLTTSTTPPSGSAQYSFPFLSNNTFLKVRPASLDAPTPFSIAGIPYDGACTNRTGARFGPRSIREASHMACDATHPLFHVSPLDCLSDHGDLVFPHTNLTEMRKQLESTAYEVLKQSPHVVWLGGDHSITLSLLRAHYKLHGMVNFNGFSYVFMYFALTICIHGALCDDNHVLMDRIPSS